MLALALAVATFASVPRIASYDIRAELDTDSHTISASETITWTNPAPAPATELRFHLYLNAFAGDDTTFFRESGGKHRRSRAAEDGWGWVQLGSLRVDGGPELTKAMRFEAPDDGNQADRTVAVVPLPDPVPPGRTIRIDVQFRARLPRVYARTGYAGDFHFLGQWFPKLGVFEGRPDGTAAWSCHQFHLNSEFYANFGDYRVELTVPDGWLVGATGQRVSQASGSGKQKVVYEQEAVHDFAAVAAREFVEVTGTFSDDDVPPPWRLRAAHLLGRHPGSLALSPVQLRLLLPARLGPLAPRILASARATLAHYGLLYGAYPYGTLTVVVPPRGASGAGGMEYPTLVTAGGTWKDLVPPRSWLQLPERVTIHEIGHQWFYGMLASNEFRHPWLDEGLNSFADMRAHSAFERDLAPIPRLPAPLNVNESDLGRLYLATFPGGEPIDSPAWTFRTTNEYFLDSYQHPALILATTERLVGEAAFARAMRAYADDNRFRHPGPADLLAAFRAHVGPEATSFLERALTSAEVCDFAVKRAFTLRSRAPRGVLAPAPGDTGEPRARDSDTAPNTWESVVLVTRNGTMAIPVVIELEYADGTRERTTWDGKASFHRIRTTTAAALRAVRVDPDEVLFIEIDRSDNVFAIEPAAVASAEVWLDAFAAALAVAGLLGGTP